jgi:hypothetical protein
MTDLADGERKLLNEMRRVLSPARSDRDRLGARIAASIALGIAPNEPPPETPDEPRASNSAGGLASGIRGLRAQVLAAALVAATGFGAGYFTGRSRPNDTAKVAAPPQRASDVRPQTSMTPVEDPPQTAGSAFFTPTSPTRRPTPSSPSAAGAATGTLSEEAHELKRVYRALRNGMPALALGILRDLDQRIPRGVLLEERAAARLIARCQIGDGEAHGDAATWLERHAQSVYAPRLRTACAEKSEP